MKLLATLLVVAATLMAACGAPASSPGAPTRASAEPAPLGSPSAAETREISMQVSGLIWQTCASQVVTGTKKIPGVVSVRMAPLDDTLYVKFDTRVTEEPALRVAIQAVIENVQ